MINSVRNTVLSILNKNNYGYISPSDFNLYAKQAQMELFEEYFSTYNKIVNMENSRLSGTSYADQKRVVEENMEHFSVSKLLFNSANNVFSLPSLVTTGDLAFMVNKVVCYPVVLVSGTNSAVLANNLEDATATFTADGISAGDIVINTDTFDTALVVTVVNNTRIIISADIFTATPESYRIIDVSVYKEVEKVNLSKITMLRSSLLTSPSLTFPAYTIQGEFLTAYPEAINTFGQIEAQYFRFPLDPKWTYITLSNGEPVFDQSQSDYQDFELPLEDEYKLVMKILQYCGVSIREAEVVSFGMAQEQHEQPTFSQKQ